MARRTGSADLPLHGGRVPLWLAERMAALGAAQIIDTYADVLVGDGGLELMYAGPGDQVQNRVAAENLVKVIPPSKTVR